MGIEKKIFSFRFERSMMERLHHYAEVENRSLSNYVETVLKRHLAEKESEAHNSKFI